MDPKGVVRRYRLGANVVPLKRVPTLLIGGRRYVLSDYFPMMGQLTDMTAARLIDVGGNRFRYLWIYDTERRMLRMWRASDGDDKFDDRASSHTHLIYTLEKKGQLNRVDHQEHQTIERYMSRKADDTLRRLQELAEEATTEWDHEVRRILRDYYERELKPEIKRRLREVESGVVPFGFRPNPNILQHRTEEEQLRQYVVTDTLKGFTQAVAYEIVSKEVGFDAYEPPQGDQQAVQWEWGNLLQAIYEEWGQGRG